MRVDRLAMAGLLAMASFISVPGSAMGQGPASTVPRASQDNSFVTPGDPDLLTPEMLTPEVDSRLFVDSFLVSLFTMDSDEVYDAYLHPEMMEALSREAFHEQVVALKEVVGPLTRVILTYLREEHQRYDGADGGWTNHVLVFERDSKVDARVEFKRTPDGHWKVIHSSIRSAQLDRLQQTKEAERQAAEAAAEPPASHP